MKLPKFEFKKSLEAGWELLFILPLAILMAPLAVIAGIGYTARCIDGWLSDWNRQKKQRDCGS